MVLKIDFSYHRLPERSGFTVIRSVIASPNSSKVAEIFRATLLDRYLGMSQDASVCITRALFQTAVEEAVEFIPC